MSDGVSKTGRRAFPSTDWSQVRRARHGAAGETRESLEILLRLYLPALRAHLIHRSRVTAEQADDLLQGFVASRILDADLIGSANPARGKFRTLLLTALDRYVISERRASNALKRGGGQVESLDEAKAREVVQEGGGADSFDIAWAREVIGQALAHMHRLCHQRRRQALWGIFDLAIVRPALEGAVVPGSRELMERFGLHSERAARNQLITARRLFARILHEVVSEYAGSRADVQEELRALRRAVLCDSAADAPGPRIHP